MEKIIQPVYIDNITNIDIKEIDELKLQEVAVELKRIAKANTSQFMGGLKNVKNDK